MMVEGLIRKDIEEYGLLKLTERGKAFLKKPYSLKLSLNHKFEDAEVMMMKIPVAVQLRVVRPWTLYCCKC
jgi:hypothetical protein